MKMSLPKKIFLGRLSLLPGSHLGRNFDPMATISPLSSPSLFPVKILCRQVKSMYVGMVLNHALFALLHSEWEKKKNSRK